MKIGDFFEDKQRGSVNFPIELYRVDSSHPQYIMPFHWHNELEIIKVYSGKLKLYIDNVPYLLSGGDIAFINCRSTHRAEPSRCRYECIVCDIGMLVGSKNNTVSSYITPLVNQKRKISHMPTDEKLRHAVGDLFKKFGEQGKIFELSVTAKLYEILAKLYENNCISDASQNEKTTETVDIITTLTEWIDKNYQTRVSLDILSKKAGVTPNYLCRIFKEYTGKTLTEYINSVRIENVCREIVFDKKSITVAASDSGFDSISYFCKVFKNVKGVTAKEYIASQKAKD